jgi:hypothetical protein
LLQELQSDGQPASQRFAQATSSILGEMFDDWADGRKEFAYYAGAVAV